jgi:hypothetical protein
MNPNAVDIFVTDNIPNPLISYFKKSPFYFSFLYSLFHIFKDMEKNRENREKILSIFIVGPKNNYSFFQFQNLLFGMTCHSVSRHFVLTGTQVPLIFFMGHM